MVEVLPQDAIPAIVEPSFMSARSIEEQMSLDERVIGLVINGDARAYPINVLSAHEIVNDVVGGEPVAVTWCPLCYTALVFSRRIEGLENELTFGVSGKLLHDTLIMYDSESGSLWSQLYGAAIDGEYAGRPLDYFPSTHTEWRVWRSEYPDTKVLSKGSNCQGIDCRTYSSDPYDSYYAAASEGLVNRQLPREAERVGPKARVFGIVLEDHARAYPLELLAKISVVGVGMRTHTGVASRMFEALHQAGVNIENISTSEIVIRCVIREQDGDTALRAVHAAFELDQE